MQVKPLVVDVIEDDGMWLDVSTMTYYDKDSLEPIDESEVDFEKELRNWMVKMDGKYALLTTDYVDQLITDTAKHFCGLRNCALEEASRHVYKSWIGGTMDDVRRDMVELGKVLNAKKKE